MRIVGEVGNVGMVVNFDGRRVGWGRLLVDWEVLLVIVMRVVLAY